MKLLIQNTKVAGTATDEYTGPEEFITAPDDFNIDRMGEYKFQDGILTLPSIKAVIIKEVQNRLDEFAKTRNYDNILSACTYATSTIQKFQVEGQYCVEIRDTTWNKLYEILLEIENNTRPEPVSYAEIESELPIPTWPG